MDEIESMRIRHLNTRMGSACRETEPYNFHTSEWLGICRDVLSKDLRIYGCFRKGELVGGCPLFVKNIKGILKVATSTCDMTSYSGPLVKESASSRTSKRIQEIHEILNPLREFLCKQI